MSGFFFPPAGFSPVRGIIFTPLMPSQSRKPQTVPLTAPPEGEPGQRGRNADLQPTFSRTCLVLPSRELRGLPTVFPHMGDFHFPPKLFPLPGDFRSPVRPPISAGGPGTLRVPENARPYNGADRVLGAPQRRFVFVISPGSSHEAKMIFPINVSVFHPWRGLYPSKFILRDVF